MAANKNLRRTAAFPNCRSHTLQNFTLSRRLAAGYICGSCQMERAMYQQTQHEIYNPFCERVDSLSATERADSERSRAWAWYANGGGGDPRYSDYQSYIRGVERQR
jgi:hypothetical protein